ncbi:hypothetical protein MARVELLAND_81 [Bacillus phage vB_BspM_MarvelLand]|nr:hypothetical protein MARVELLAND_81 [Bacillus phage vB_BspM_MarvelLand]
MNKYTVSTAIVENANTQAFLSEVARFKDKLLNDGYEVEVQYQVIPREDNNPPRHYMYIEGRKLNGKITTVEYTQPQPQAPQQQEKIMSHNEYINFMATIDAFKGTGQMDFNAHNSMTRFINTIYNRQKQR